MEDEIGNWDYVGLVGITRDNCQFVVLDSSPCRIWYRVPEADLKMVLVSIQASTVLHL